MRFPPTSTFHVGRLSGISHRPDSTGVDLLLRRLFMSDSAAPGSVICVPPHRHFSGAKPRPRPPMICRTAVFRDVALPGAAQRRLIAKPGQIAHRAAPSIPVPLRSDQSRRRSVHSIPTPLREGVKLFSRRLLPTVRCGPSRRRVAMNLPPGCQRLLTPQ